MKNKKRIKNAEDPDKTVRFKKEEQNVLTNGTCTCERRRDAGGILHVIKGDPDCPLHNEKLC